MTPREALLHRIPYHSLFHANRPKTSGLKLNAVAESRPPEELSRDPRRYD
jgi:hypothetical protein